MKSHEIRLIAVREVVLYSRILTFKRLRFVTFGLPEKQTKRPKVLFEEMENSEAIDKKTKKFKNGDRYEGGWKNGLVTVFDSLFFNCSV